MANFTSIRSLWLLLLLITSLGTQLHAQRPENLIEFNATNNYEIGGITITGVKYLDANVLINLSGLSVGDKIAIPGDDIARAVKTLWRQGLFADVKIVATRFVNDVVFIEIQLRERERLAKYAFEGTKKNEEEDLRDRIGLVRGRVLDDDLMARTRSSVLGYYRDKGFFNATISLSQEKDTTILNSSNLIIKVQRGEKMRIESISFAGNEALSDRPLKRQMKETKERTQLFPRPPAEVWDSAKQTNWLRTLENLSTADLLQFFDENVFRFRLFTPSKFNAEDFEADKRAVVSYYNDKGYRDARIVQDTVFATNERSLQIQMQVEEGQRYYIRSIDWKGNNKYTDETLSRILGISRGDIYSQSDLNERLYQSPAADDVSSLYMDDGYLFFQINPLEKTISGNSVDLEINIYEGAQATVDEVIISGNTKTNEHVIRREIRSVPGSKFSRSDIVRSTREIANLGYFDPEKIEVNPIPNPTEGTVDIEYKLVEKPSDQLELSVGWGGPLGG